MRRLSNQSGFSLMEMMIVLAIVAIVAAASAPMLNKKMVHTMSEGQSLWSRIGNSNSIAYNFNDPNNNTVNIGKIDLNSSHPRLYIHTKADNQPHIVFDSDKTDSRYNFIVGGEKDNIWLSSKAIDNNVAGTCLAIGQGAYAQKAGDIAIGEGSQATGGDGIAIGSLKDGSKTTASGNGSIAIGDGTQAEGLFSVAIGRGVEAKSGRSIAIGSWHQYDYSGSTITDHTKATHDSSMAVGSGAQATNVCATAVGPYSKASADRATALGDGSSATAQFATAIGGATASHYNSVAIGRQATTKGENQIELGTNAQTVHIPGNLVVDGTISISNLTIPGHLIVKGTTVLGGAFYPLSIVGTGKEGALYKGTPSSEANNLKTDGVKPDEAYDFIQAHFSDRRLKNVGEAFKGGLAEIKKLEVFHYTFKDDKDKTPRVGVIAQDLKKIFPDAVIKGEDGFLRIRMEDMFYALVNAVKELDLRINTHDKRIAELEKQNQELQEQNKAILKRLEALEKLK